MNSQMLVLSSYTTLICLTILLMILVTLASLRLHLWTWILVLMLGMCQMTQMDQILEMMNPRTQTPMQKTMYLILRISHCIIYMISSVQWVLSSNLGWRGTQAAFATETQRMASFWCLRTQFGNTGSLYSPWKSKVKWELVQWLCKSKLSQSEINLFLSEYDPAYQTPHFSDASPKLFCIL